MQQLRPTFSESWYRVADLRARLRGSAQISRQHYRGDRWYVVRDPAGNQFHRLSAAAYRFVGLLDGSRSVAEAWDLVGGQLADEAPTQNEVIQILTQLHAANLLETNITPDAQVLLRRHKRMVKQQWQGRLMNVMFPRIPLWDPDRFLCRWMPVVKPFLSWVGSLLWIAVVMSAVFMLVPKWPQLKTAASKATNPNNWPFLWATFVLIKLIHELGHAFSCRRFGGEVHELGVMFLVFIPTPYVDASSAWSFPSKWAKMFVGAGGMIIELFVAAIMAFIWAKTAPGTIHDLAYNTMLIASVSTVGFNANPLLRYDGYYILSDYLEIPNLRQKAQEYAMGLIKRHLFGVKSQQPLPPVGQRVWLFIYAIASGIYRVFVGIMIIMVVSDRVPVLGVLMALGGIVTWLVVPIFKVSNYLLLDPELHRKRPIAIGWTSAAVAAAIILIGYVKMPQHYEAAGVLEPITKVVMHAEVPGQVVSIEKKHGDLVKQGDVILVCKDPELKARINGLAARREVLEINLEKAKATEEIQVKAVEAQIVAVDYELKLENRKFDALTIRAPIDGQLVSSELHNLQDKHLQMGEELLTIMDVSKLTVRAIVPKDDEALPIKEPGRIADVRLSSMRDRNIVGRVVDRLPTARDEAPASLTYAGGGDIAADPSDKEGKRLLQPQFELFVDVDNPDLIYVPGQRAWVRFTLSNRPLAWQWGRRIGQLIQEHSHGKWI